MYRLRKSGSNGNVVRLSRESCSPSPEPTTTSPKSSKTRGKSLELIPLVLLTLLLPPVGLLLILRYWQQSQLDRLQERRWPVTRTNVVSWLHAVKRRKAE